jgi:hypothetical protein
MTDSGVTDSNMGKGSLNFVLSEMSVSHCGDAPKMRCALNLIAPCGNRDNQLGFVLCPTYR